MRPAWSCAARPATGSCSASSRPRIRPTSDSAVWPGSASSDGREPERLGARRAIPARLHAPERLTRLLNGQQGSCLELGQCATGADSDGNRSHRSIVGCLPEVVGIVFAQGVPEAMKLSADGLDVTLGSFAAVLRMFSEPRPGFGRVAETR